MITDKIIVVPDIHGRTFWKTVQDDQYSDYEIVFLGDYLDPYTYPEGITFNQSLSNFIEILEFAKVNKDRVHLLLGNHDCHYISLSEDICRMDLENKTTIFNLLKDNKDLFNVAYKWNNTLFTHAGITTGWLSNNQKTFSNADSTNIDSILNNILHSTDWKKPVCGFDGIRNCIYTPLADIGYSRGGLMPYGSCVWADISELENMPAFCNFDKTSGDLSVDLYQIIGHTRLLNPGTTIHEANWWMCDSRECFIWNEKEQNLIQIN